MSATVMITKTHEPLTTEHCYVLHVSSICSSSIAPFPTVEGGGGSQMVALPLKVQTGQWRTSGKDPIHMRTFPDENSYVSASRSHENCSVFSILGFRVKGDCF